jgi:hypothetical protein
MPLEKRETGQVIAVRMLTGGVGYTSTPTVTFSGGGGSGATGVVHMAGTHVERINITDGGSGYTSDPTITFTSHGETYAAEAVAYAHTDSFRPMSFFRSRQNDVYGVDGMGRGLRWDARNYKMEPIGLRKPAIAPSIAKDSTATQLRLAAIQVQEVGTGYTDIPTVTISGGGGSGGEGTARIGTGSVRSIQIKDRGTGYTQQPNIAITGGQGGGATLSVTVAGKITTVTMTNQGSGYSSAPTVTFSGGNVAGATATAVLTGDKVSSVTVNTRGTCDGPVTVSFSGGGGSNAAADVVVDFTVASVSVTNGGNGYFADTNVKFTKNTNESLSGGAVATATTDGNGVINGVTVEEKGTYNYAPTAAIAGVQATASAIMSKSLTGKYQCYIRYYDDTPATERGPITSSVGERTEVDCGEGSDGLTWSFSHGADIDDRVAGMQLWRTTGDQIVILFKVAEIARTDAAFNGTYHDTIDDGSLKDPKRADFGIMPITLPNGAINARRFTPPPPNFAVGVMFQDRAWYAVDTTGFAPNLCAFSEVDEPESVPGTNGLIIQESISDSDSLVGLIPLGSLLIAAQSRHLYTIQYVSQPIIDASVVLACYRGMLNSRCHGVINGVAYIADSAGLYGFDGNREEPISVPIDNLWRNGEIDFSKKDKFFIKTDIGTRTIRFFYCNSTDTYPQRSLCYCIASQAWWKEEYGKVVAGGTNTIGDGQLKNIYGSGSGNIYTPTGDSDDGVDIAYEMHTGNLPLSNADNGSRTVNVVYSPTTDTSELNVQLHYNNSATPRDNAIQTRPGTAFRATTQGGVIDMKNSVSELGDSTGLARANYSGRVDPLSAGGDKHIAIDFSGTQNASSNRPVIHKVIVEGAGG